MRNLVAILLIAVGLSAVACGGSSGGGMTTPTPTLTSITVNSTGAQVLLGSPETFTATANFSNGTNEPVTGGVWGSEQPSIASVDSATGRVTGLVAGAATIFVTSQGLRGTKPINVRPNYAGTWIGTYGVATCTQSGSWTTLDFCTTNFTIARELPYGLLLAQLNAGVNGQTALGQLISTPFSATMATNGSVTLNATVLSGTLTIAQVWNLNITEAGKITGNMTQTWTDPSFTGQLVVTANLLTSVLQSNVAMQRQAFVPGPADETFAHAPGRALAAAVQAISDACCSPRSNGFVKTRR
ncbi:MAG TPA: Ig-like domain-containing protein [Vicinamibacterales bacterium]|nr:Ig-like domain-containing protein [Vicinamibacterales bacterium]